MAAEENVQSGGDAENGAVEEGPPPEPGAEAGEPLGAVEASELAEASEPGEPEAAGYNEASP